MDNLKYEKNHNQGLISQKNLLGSFKLCNGLEFLIRPLNYLDIPLWKPFIESCSKNSLYSRFQGTSPGLIDQGEEYFQTDYENIITLGVEVHSENNPELIAVSWLVRDLQTNNVEVALLVADKWQQKGIATKLCDHCRSILLKWNVRDVIGSTSIKNIKILSLLKKHQANIKGNFEDNTVSFELALI